MIFLDVLDVLSFWMFWMFCRYISKVWRRYTLSCLDEVKSAVARFSHIGGKKAISFVISLKVKQYRIKNV